jgi:hypothetical protein
MKNIILSLCCILNIAVNAQQWDWAKCSQGPGFEYGRSISVDGENNVYVTGEFYSTSMTIGTITLANRDSSGTSSDFFIAKYDANGNVLWAKNGGGISNDAVFAASADAVGNVFITGYFRSSSINFGSFTIYNSNSSVNMFIVKYDANGNVLWAKSANAGTGKSISTDRFGNVFVTGSFLHPQMSFGAITLFNSDGSWYSEDFFIAKYDANGNVLWAKRAGQGGKYLDEEGTSINVDVNGHVLVTGYFRGSSITFDSTTISNAGGGTSMYGFYDLFIVKFDANGNILWAKSEGGNKDDFGFAINSDPIGNVFITGGYQSSNISFGSNILINSSSGNRNMFIAKYDSNGNALWAKSANNATGLSIDTDLAGNLYVTGAFSDSSITFAPYIVSQPPSATYPMFIVKYSATGDVFCASSLACGSFNSSVSVDSLSNAYITGFFDINPFIIGTNTLLLTGQENVFVAKYTCDNDVATNELSNEASVAVYPNPSFGIFTIGLEHYLDAKICVFDVLGNCLVTKYFKDNTKAEIDLRSQSKGVYFMEVTVGGKRSVNKIVLQ